MTSKPGGGALSASLTGPTPSRWPARSQPPLSEPPPADYVSALTAHRRRHAPPPPPALGERFRSRLRPRLSLAQFGPGRFRSPRGHLRRPRRRGPRRARSRHDRPALPRRRPFRAAPVRVPPRPGRKASGDLRLDWRWVTDWRPVERLDHVALIVDAIADNENVLYRPPRPAAPASTGSSSRRSGRLARRARPARGAGPARRAQLVRQAESLFAWPERHPAQYSGEVLPVLWQLIRPGERILTPTPARAGDSLTLCDGRGATFTGGDVGCTPDTTTGSSVPPPERRAATRQRPSPSAPRPCTSSRKPPRRLPGRAQTEHED